MLTRLSLSAALLLGAAGCPSQPDGPAPAYDVVINEVQATNASTIADETGAFADWIELWNAGDAELELTGHYLTDDLSNPTRWRFPDATTIAPGEHLVIFADGDVDDGPLHASFSLAADGEDVGLFGPLAHGAPQLDALTFEAQVVDQSVARLPDGAADWAVDPTPTPGEPNG